MNGTFVSDHPFPAGHWYMKQQQRGFWSLDLTVHKEQQAKEIPP